MATLDGGGDPDPRVQRTTLALGHALIELAREKDFDRITVQEIIDRAGIGRATFYSHYRNKTDALHSGFERVFAMCEAALEPPTARGARLLPVTEFLEHVQSAAGLMDSLRRAGELDTMWQLCADYAARIIDRRLAATAGGASRANHPLLPVMLAGAFVELVRWWELHAATTSPRELDAAFHAFARSVR